MYIEDFLFFHKSAPDYSCDKGRHYSFNANPKIISNTMFFGQEPYLRFMDDEMFDSHRFLKHIRWALIAVRLNTNRILLEDVASRERERARNLTFFVTSSFSIERLWYYSCI